MTFDRRSSLDSKMRQKLEDARKSLKELLGHAANEEHDLQGDFNTPAEQKKIARLKIVQENVAKMQALLDDAYDAIDY